MFSSNTSLPWTGLITTLALILYFFLTFNVGRARIKYKVTPPETSGPADFERVLRVQQNTLEQLILFLPALWLFSLFLNSVVGAAIGTVWLVGRGLYAWGYYQAAEKRMPGFMISVFAIVLLLIGSLVGTVLSLNV